MCFNSAFTQKKYLTATRIYTATTESVFKRKLDKIVEQELLECTI